jgi:hypothetical protein
MTSQPLAGSGPCYQCGQPKEAHDQCRCPSPPLAYSGLCYRCGQPKAAHPQGRCPSPPLPSQRARRPSGSRNLWITGIGLAVVLAIIVGARDRGTGSPSYQQGFSYATRYMRAGGGGNLIVPLSFLPKVCNDIAKRNPYGVSGAPGSDPGSAWIRGCVAGLQDAPNYSP